MKTLLALAWSLLIVPVAAADEIHRDFRNLTPAAGVEHVEVRLSVGEVEIRSSTGKDIEVRGRISRKVDDEDRQKAEEIVRDLAIEVEIRGDRAIIRETRGTSRRFGFSRAGLVHSELEVLITLPAGVNLEVEQSVGELEIDGNFRDLEVKMRVGEMTVRLPRANVKELSAGTRVGEVRADFGDRWVSREGVLAGRARYVNEKGGSSRVDLNLTIGEIHVVLN